MNIFPSVKVLPDNNNNDDEDLETNRNISNTITKKKTNDTNDTNDTISSETDLDILLQSMSDDEHGEHDTSDVHSIKKDNISNIDHDNINSKSILDILEQNEHSSTTLIKKKKNGLYSLNTYDEIFFKKYKDRLVRKKEVYTVSSELFQKKSLCLTIPCILITCMMSIISFFSASTYFTENTRIILGLVVGSLGSLGTLFQTFQSALNYNTKAEAFRNAAEKYDKLITKIKFEIYNHNEHDFIDTLEKEVLKISSACKYFPPQSVKNLVILNTKYTNKVTHLLEKYEHDKERTHSDSTTVRDINNMRISIGD